jgi:glutathione S-transferase
MIPVFLSLPYSPWSERAKWALDVCRVDYQKRLYQPIFGEPELRWRLKKWFGTVSVPILILGDGVVIGDSLEIAKWADTHGLSAKLFPAGLESKITHWNNVAQNAMAAGRLLSLARVLQREDALLELVPKALRLGPPSIALARFGVERIMKKYSVGKEPAAQETQLIAALEALRQSLGPNSSEKPATLLAEFSYADITAAQMLCFVKPPESRHLKLAKYTRELFGDPPLAERFADLLAWRDRLYSLYREPRS